MQAVIATGGKQYLVSAGDRIRIDKIPGEAGAPITFDQVLMVNNGTIKIGRPLVQGASVTGTIVAQEKGKKIIVFKLRRRKGYHKKQGHRQQLTRVEIGEIKS